MFSAFNRVAVRGKMWAWQLNPERIRRRCGAKARLQAVLLHCAATTRAGENPGNKEAPVGKLICRPGLED